MNPGIEQLADNSHYELIHKVHYKEMRSFVLRHVASRSQLIRFYSIFQIISLIVPFALIAHEIVSISTEHTPWNRLLWIIAGLVFSFTALILIHELMHMLAFRILGRRDLRIGASFRQFIFYVEANKQVVNKREYLFIAIMPFALILTFGLLLTGIFWSDPIAYFILTITSVHSLFCAGDFAIISLMYRDRKEMFTFDDTEQKMAYFYREN